MSNQATLAVTRVANSCVLLEINGHAVLTDPFFTERWHLHRGEPLGMTVGELPQLDAIVASHSYPNHWDLRALRTFPRKDVTPVFVSSPRMARQARNLGFRQVEHLEWGQTGHPTEELSIEATPAGRTLLWRHNAYVLSAGGIRVFFGGEIRDVSLLERYRAEHPPVDLALLPVNGLRAFAGPPIVMGPEQAVAGSSALGARVLVPVHDAHGDDDLLARVIRRNGTGIEAKSLADAREEGPEVVNLPTGHRWTYPGVSSS
ncbi:MBL fold metallo-hydrolase [Nonomuraea guangzhouensis]|uniref:MBL fold metallo-hydrolase n=1 Tax=Nonomuraea guangzhouensis TaxID=1291555 RepID=A0ABW4GUV3_9ACTN|nr:MBL fold metallo-hydrolase [Nonomuraea guangzhouensis]